MLRFVMRCPKCGETGFWNIRSKDFVNRRTSKCYTCNVWCHQVGVYKKDDHRLKEISHIATTNLSSPKHI